jgi:HlyD family secretion protein
MKRFVIAFVVLVIGLGGLLWWQLDTQRAVAEAPSGGSGTVEGTRINVVPRLGARIKAIHVREGDVVTAGQPLVVLDCTEPEALLAEATAAVGAAEAGLAAAEAGIEAASAGVGAAEAGVAGAQAGERGAKAARGGINARRDTAQRTVGRLEALHTGGQASDNQLDEAQTMRRTLGAERRAADARIAGARAQRAAAEAQVSAASKQVLAARAKRDAVAQDGARARSAIVRAQALVAECTLTAPAPSVVQTRAAEPGELARPGMPLLTLVDAREVTATFFLPNAELSVAEVGRDVQLTADAWPDRTWAGTIARVSAEAEFTPRNVQTREDRDRLVYAVEVRLANADGALRPGMPVQVTLPGTGGAR